jgi:hypothetical protein
MPDKALPKIMCAQITGTEKAIRTLLSKHPMETGSTKREGTAIILEVFVPEQDVEKLSGEGIKIQVLYDASARGRERQQEVGKGNRFEGEQRVPRGLGIKTKAGTS